MSNGFLIVLRQIFYKATMPTNNFILNILKFFDNIYTKFADNLVHIITDASKYSYHPLHLHFINI